MNNEFVCTLIDKVWMDTEDIKKLCNCGWRAATSIRNEVEDQVKESGKRLPGTKRKVIPSLLTLEYLGIDVDKALDLRKKQEVIK